MNYLVKRKPILKIYMFFFLLGPLVACTSAPSLKRQKYARYPSERSFKYSLPEVTKAVKKSLQEHKILIDFHEDPMPSKTSKPLKLQTDWIEAMSPEQYQIHQINQSTTKLYLKSRLKYTIYLEKTAFATLVKIETQQQVQPLSEQGELLNYKDSNPDSTFAHELLEKIQKALLEEASE